MKDDLTEQQAKAILEVLDDAINKGPWEESNFLKVIGKKLHTIRDDFVTQLGVSQSLDKPLAGLARAGGEVANKEVFIALYSSEGSNIQSWERILANLPRQIISRPVYEDENAVQAFIKSKENKINEAYVSIHINQNNILALPQDKVPVDRLGNPLLSIKDRSLNLDNINRFVHYSGVYNYVKGRLFKNN